MVTLGTLLLFGCAVVGFTNIVVDPATIFKPIRDKVEKWCEGKELGIFSWTQPFWKWLNGMWACYQCTGFWVGVICGIILVSFNPFIVFICGVAGSFIATWGATYLNYLEAQSVVLEK